jgi:hypothetical protein
VSHLRHAYLPRSYVNSANEPTDAQLKQIGLSHVIHGNIIYQHNKISLSYFFHNFKSCIISSHKTVPYDAQLTEMQSFNFGKYAILSELFNTKQAAH